MPTQKPRKTCIVCKSKFLQERMFFLNNWFCSDCKESTKISLEPHKTKCPREQYLLQRFNTPFHIDIRIIAPLTFELYFEQEFNKHINHT
jgi:hypothetical protein